MYIVFENCRRLSNVTHDGFYLLQLGYKLIKYRISSYNQKMVYSEFQEYPRSINKEGRASRVDLFVTVLLLLFCLASLL